jgi:hypothetical protein
MLSRRALIGKAAVGAVAAVALGASRKGVAAVRLANDHGATDDVARTAPPLPAELEAIPAAPSAAAETVTAPPPWELLRPLGAGAAVARGWRLLDLSPVRHGACVATLANARGRSYRIHICRNDGTPRGLLHTRRLDLVVMNGGRGDLPTDEGFAQAVARLARVVAKNERTAADGVLANLLPHAERLQRFAGAQLR